MTIAPIAQELTAERVAQQELLDRGYEIGAVDGIWGPRSAAAMRNLQRELGIAETGLPDLETMEVLASPPGPASQPEPGPPVTYLEPATEPVAPEPFATETAVPEAGAAPTTSLPEPTPTVAVDLPPPEQPFAIIPPKANDVPISAAPGQSRPIEIAVPAAVDAADAGSGGAESLLAGIGIVTLLGAIVVFLVSKARGVPKEKARTEPLPGHSRVTGPPSGALPAASPQPVAPLLKPLGQAASESIRLHNAAVDEAVRNRASQAGPAFRLFPVASPPRTPRRESVRSPWVPGHETVTVGGLRLRGFIYVGEALKPQNGWSARDNCLVVPSLKLAARADVSGEHLDYWPSYERLAQSSRKAYLDWLATDRSNPDTPLGYVFLYFYGLERRLMLDEERDERDAIIGEVHRLVGIYGGNASFRRYSAELLGAASVMDGGRGEESWHPIALGDVPIADRFELGRLAAAGRPIPPSLLLSLVANHPETRLRAPVRRLPELVSERFCAMVARDHPHGLTLSLPRTVPKLEVVYRSASSTFEVPVVGAAHSVPDLSQLTEPLGYGRALLDAVTDELDGYSREIGKSDGAPTSIAGLSKLPPALRHRQASAVAGPAMAALEEVADGRKIHRLADVLALVGLRTDLSTKVGLRELSQCLAGWGMGIVPDPHFVPKILADRDTVLVFRIDVTKPVESEPGAQYRMTYVSLALGVVVANSDGSVSEAERRMLSRLILDTPGLSEQEQRRLVADFRWLEANPLDVSYLRQFLRETTSEFRTALMRNLVSVSASDGNMDAGEVGVLERLAKILGLNNAIVYEALHQSQPEADDLAMLEAPMPGAGHPIPGRPLPGPTRSFDTEKLASIRAETAYASTLLNDIFADEPETTPDEVVEPVSATDELDQRHRALLDELVTRPEWSGDDFERLVRHAGLMPGSAKARINDWSIERFDELILEGDGTIVVNSSLVLESA